MRLMYKQLARQLLRNKIFVALLWVLIWLTALSFFFIMFSVDGNKAVLTAQTGLAGNEMAYQNALAANTSLAYRFLFSLTGLTAFVFIMFFYRFFRSGRRQIGCLRALGFQNRELRRFFVMFSAALSMLGALPGMAGGYLLSGILLQANMQTYEVTGLVKSISLGSAAAGLFAAAAVFCMTAFACYGFVRGKEAGALLAGGKSKQGCGAALRMADMVSGRLPLKNKFPLRIALRKSVSVLLIFAAVMALSVCIILGKSLNISSQKMMDMQTAGRAYACDIKYEAVQQQAATEPDSMPYLVLSGTVAFGKTELDCGIIALYGADSVFTLLDGAGEALPAPKANEVIIGPGPADIYKMRVGDKILVSLGGNRAELSVIAVADNAEPDSIYMHAETLTRLAALPMGAYNGALRADIPGGSLPAGARMITAAERTAELARGAVSNNVSAVINQVTGVLVGCILMFLALYLNFQDNTRDMLILHLMGYQSKEIRRLFVDVCRPIACAAFLITLAPGILLARSIQRSLSIAIGEYMPFGINIWVVLFCFAALLAIYVIVQAAFGWGIGRVVAKEEISRFTAAE